MNPALDRQKHPTEWSAGAGAINQDILPDKRPWAAARKVYREALDLVLQRRGPGETGTGTD